MMKKRRDGCIDMATYLCEHLCIPQEQLLQEAAIDIEDFNDKHAFELLNIPIVEPTHQSDDEDEDEREEEEDEEDNSNN